VTLAVAIGLAFAMLGAGAERLASVWPSDEPSRRGPGPRTVIYGAVAGLAGGGMALRANLPGWALGVQLAILAILLLLTATDLEQRRLPHVLLDPLIILAALFVPFNPGLGWRDALIGAVAAVAFLGLLGLIVRGGVARGDLLLIAPLGLVLGWPTIFSAMFIAGLLSAAFGLALLATRRAGLRSYIPFGPFLVTGSVISLIRDPALLGQAAAAAAALLRP
jgi:leader peptidase (prepilin peptidase)/N-methyltransferase